MFEFVCAESSLTGFTIDERVNKAFNVARRFPSARVHENRSIQSLDVVAIRHRFPPGILDVEFEFNSERTIIPARADPAINFRRRENKSSSLAERYEFLKAFEFF
jgi:hypothetical protein